MGVSVVVATYGDFNVWGPLANRACLSAIEANIWEVIPVHGASLHEARNAGLARVEADYVIFLDADDELSPDYVAVLLSGEADVRAPSVSYIPSNNVPSAPQVPKVFGHAHECSPPCLAYGNYIVVGALMRTEKVRAVGGFRDYAVYEDWDLFARMWQAGATFETIPKAVYLAHSRPHSRNKSLSPAERHRVHQDIARANGLPIPA